MKNFKQGLIRLGCFFSALVFAFGLFSRFFYVSAEPAISAKSAILMDFDSGLVLCQKDAHKKMGMASTTKIMTALTVLQLLRTDDVVSIPPQAVGIEGSSVYLCEGERLTVEQLLYALLLSSANDAAAALAICASGSIERFADKMNEYAYALGAHDTHFTNPHGLYDKEHYTTAYDLALITRASLEDSTLKKIFSTYKTTIPLCSEPDRRLLVNHNKLLKMYDGAIGVKTGFTKSTGRCLVSAAKREVLTLICVTLCAPDDWHDHTAMLDYGFENYTRTLFADVGEYTYSLPLCGGVSTRVSLTNTEPLALTLPKGHASAEYTVNSNYRFIYSPVKQDYIYANVTVTVGDMSVCSPLIID